jgi:hypothetical protein
MGTTRGVPSNQVYASRAGRVEASSSTATGSSSSACVSAFAVIIDSVPEHLMATLLPRPGRVDSGDRLDRHGHSSPVRPASGSTAGSSPATSVDLSVVDRDRRSSATPKATSTIVTMTALWAYFAWAVTSPITGS